MFYLSTHSGTPTPLIVSVPHSGKEIPDEVQKSLVNSDPIFLTTDSDLFVDELYESVPSHGGTLLVTPFCRYVIDLNRDANEWDSTFVEKAPTASNPKHLGLVAHKTMKGDKLLKAPLTQSELKKRIELYYAPFHNQLKKIIQDTKDKFGFCIHIDAHSMPSRGVQGHADSGAKRADVCLGDLDGKSCDARFTKWIEEHFQKSGHSVNRNIPYRGGFITEHYGRPSESVHTIQIELNRKLYMNEKTHEKLDATFQKLKNTIDEMLIKVSIRT